MRSLLMNDEVSGGQLLGGPDSSEPAAPPEESPSPGNCRIRRMAVRLLVIAVVGWAVFLLMQILLAGRWWLWSVPEDIPPVLLIAVPLLLLAAVLTRLGRGIRRPLSATVLVTLVAGVPLAGINLDVLLPHSDRPGAHPVKVFSWNADYWDMEDDPRTFIGYLQSKHADVYLLQEYLYWHDGDGADSGPVRIDKVAQLSAAFPGYHIEVDGELLTMSRLPVVATYPDNPTGGPEPWYWKGRKAQRVDLSVDGKVLSVYNVHLPQTLDLGRNPFTADFYRFLHYQDGRLQTQLDQLRADLNSNHNPKLVTGDFNSSWMGTLVRLPGGLDRHDPTSGSPLPISFSFLGPIPPLWRFDWVFTTSNVSVTGYRFVSSDGLSDHLGQQLEVSMS
jgi:endonuclease/exonuclease/phosphatase (EEP) superfamily protein YafD